MTFDLRRLKKCANHEAENKAANEPPFDGSASAVPVVLAHDGHQGKQGDDARRDPVRQNARSDRIKKIENE